MKTHKEENEQKNQNDFLREKVTHLRDLNLEKFKENTYLQFEILSLKDKIRVQRNLIIVFASMFVISFTIITTHLFGKAL